MNNNQINYPSLQRRRRRSDHILPNSPSFPRRLVDRGNRHGDVSSPTEPTDDPDSPSLNGPLSAPAYDRFSPLPTGLAVTKTSSNEQKPYLRSSEDTGRPRFRTSDEGARPATSDAGDPNKALPYTSSRVALDTADLPLRRSPVVTPSSADSRERTPFESRTRGGDSAWSPGLRSNTFSSTYHDDPVSSKAHVGKKSRLNLLNPMSLLARRRSSQNQKLDDVNLSINTLPVPALPDNFDPSIRGKMVHDFSAPRTRRLYSHNDIGNLDSPALRSGYSNLDSPALRSQSGWDMNDSPGGNLPSPPTQQIPHSPMFKEHFQEDRPSLQPDRTGYLHNINAFNIAHDTQDPNNVPAFAKRLPSAVPQPRLDPSPLQDRINLPTPSPGESSPPPPTPPPKSTPSPKFDVPPPALLPKHMTSTSSRFSFQMSGSEKLLEERHKQHEAIKKTDVGAEDEEDDYADYDFDADDGFEEPIPLVNADFDEEDDFGNDTTCGALVARYAAPEPDLPPPAEVQKTDVHGQSLQGFHFTPQSLTFSPTSTNNASQPTPRDHEGFAIGIADSRAPSQHEHADVDAKDGLTDVDKFSMLGGLGITTAEVNQRRRSQQITRPQGQVFDDDDLYFDDGEFDDIAMDRSSGDFDEQIFDDETEKIRDIPAENARKFEAAKQLAGLDGDVRAVNDLDQDEGTIKAPRSSGDLHQTQAASAQGNSIAGLTETNLAAYHDALAFAANQAAANGKFDRKVSFSQNSDDTSQSPFESSQQGVISNDSRFSHNFSSAIAEDDGFPFDDDLEDDPMIAEANAEALENDDEGFYGQEFGFYARSYGKTNSEPVNGGYFADRGANGIKRSHSGKANFQEPSLTPITERSEWSTRNSISLQIPGGMGASAQALPSPGIARLVELDSPGYDDDMNFSALMKLRGRTFGGSTSSLNSSVAGHPSSSPLAHFSHHQFGPGDLGSSRMSSSIHGRSSPVGILESEEEEEMDQATLTQNTPRKKLSEPGVGMLPEDMPSSPAPVGGERRKGHHSRTSSGAESVSYARDTDGRWVLERRRTDEGSGTEVVDREYLAGAQI